MNFLTIISFVLTFYTTLITFLEERSTLERSASCIALFFSAYFLFIGTLEFFTSNKSKRLRIKYYFLSLIYGEFFESKINDLFSKGQSVYCNPFTCMSMDCSHEMSITVNDGGLNNIVFYDVEGINLRLLIPTSNVAANEIAGSACQYRDTQVVKGVEKMIYKVGGTSDCLLLLNSIPFCEGCVLEYNWIHEKTEISLRYGVLERSLNCETIKSTGHVKADLFEMDGVDFVRCLRFLEYINLSKRTCCFVIKSRKVFNPENGRMHCYSICEVVDLISKKVEFSFTKNPKNKVVEGGTKSYSEGLRFSLISKYGGELKCISSYLKSIGMSDDSVDYIMFKLSISDSWYIKRFTELKEIGNWKFKRLGVDISYIMEKLGLCRLKSVDLNLNPTLKVMSFLNKNVDLIESEKKEYISCPVVFCKVNNFYLKNFRITKKCPKIIEEIRNDRAEGRLVAREGRKIEEVSEGKSTVGSKHRSAKGKRERSKMELTIEFLNKASISMERASNLKAGNVLNVSNPKDINAPKMKQDLALNVLSFRNSTSSFTGGDNRGRKGEMMGSLKDGVSYMEALNSGRYSFGKDNEKGEVHLSGGEYRELLRSRLMKGYEVIKECLDDKLAGYICVDNLNRKLKAKRGKTEHKGGEGGGKKERPTKEKSCLVKMASLGYYGALNGSWLREVESKKGRKPEDEEMKRVIFDVGRINSYKGQLVSRLRKSSEKKKRREKMRDERLKLKEAEATAEKEGRSGKTKIEQERERMEEVKAKRGKMEVLAPEPDCKLLETKGKSVAGVKTEDAIDIFNEVEEAFIKNRDIRIKIGRDPILHKEKYKDSVIKWGHKKMVGYSFELVTKYGHPPMVRIRRKGELLGYNIDQETIKEQVSKEVADGQNPKKFEKEKRLGLMEIDSLYHKLKIHGG